MRTYHWPAFRLEVDPAARTVATVYGDGARSVTRVHRDDAFHAARYRIGTFDHRIAHELAHHVVSLARFPTQATGCRIIWRDAHGAPQPEREAAVDEWLVTAFTDFSFHVMPRDPGEWGALLDLHAAGIDLVPLAAHFRWLLAAPDGVDAIHCTPAP